MKYDEIDEFLHKYTDAEIKQLELIKNHFKFSSIEETLIQLSYINDFSFLQPAFIPDNGNLNIKNPSSVLKSHMLTQKFISDNIASNDKLNYIFLNKNSRFKEVLSHKHNYIEISYIYSGELTQTINGEKIKLKKGDIVILDTNVSHSIELAKTNDIMINFLMFKNYFNSTFFKHLDGNGLMSNFLLNALNDKKDSKEYIIFHTGDSTEVRNLINKIIYELTEDTLCSQSMIDCCFIMLFTELLRIYATEDNSYEHTSDDETSSKLKSILYYIEDNYNNITLDSVAKHFHFSPKYFSAMIKKATGKNFTDIILEQRLIHSSLLLKNTTMPIEDICNATGFSNTNFFYKKFKSLYSMTPKEYRENSTKNT